MLQIKLNSKLTELNLINVHTFTYEGGSFHFKNGNFININLSKFCKKKIHIQ
jgi:hypothetical protein